jgi:hypothetical protein
MHSKELMVRIVQATGVDAGVVALRWDGASVKEIAALLDRSPKRIYQRLKRAAENIERQVPEVADDLRARRAIEQKKRPACPGCGQAGFHRLEGWRYCHQCRWRSSVAA